MTENVNFNKILGRLDVVALAFGAMIGWGWVILAGGWIINAGILGTVLAFLFGSIAIILIGLTYSELASAMPNVGGEHVYTDRALGRFWSFVCTWAIILGYVSVVAFEAVALPTVIEYLFPNYNKGLMYSIAGWDVYFTWVLIGVIGSLTMAWINIKGIATAALIQKTVTLAIILVGIYLILGGASHIDPNPKENLFGSGFSGITSVIIMVPFLFVGFDVIPQAAEEINLKHKYIGILLIVSIIMAIFWYIGTSVTVGLVMTEAEIKQSSLPVADAMAKITGSSIGGKIIVLAGLCGIVTSWNAFLIGGSRAIYALAEAKLLPTIFAKIHPIYKTPVNAIILIATFSTLAPLFGRKVMVWLVDSGGLGIIIAYFFVALSFLVLRKKEPNMQRPFKVANGKVVGILAVALSLILGLLYLPFSPSALTKEEWLIFLGWCILGAILYSYAYLTNKKPTSSN